MIHDEMETVVKTYGINTFKHFMAYKGALMVNDDEMYNSFKRCAELGALPLVHAENGDVVARMQADLARSRSIRFARSVELLSEALCRLALRALSLAWELILLDRRDSPA